MHKLFISSVLSSEGLELVEAKELVRVWGIV